MKNLLTPALITFSFVLLSGCATQPMGNYLDAAAGQPEMAYSVTEKLSGLYPPAKTTFYVSQKVVDPFGLNLLEDLRKRGFGVYANTAKKNNTTDAPATALPLSYVVDKVSGTSALYRVVLNISGVKLIRAYGVQNGKVYPAGTWARMDNND